jgi:hypothetical protein
MDRNGTKDQNLFGADGLQNRELTEAELDAVSGSVIREAPTKMNVKNIAMKGGA